MSTTNPNLKNTNDLKTIFSELVDKLKGSMNKEQQEKFKAAMNDPSIKARVEAKVNAIKNLLKDDKTS